MSRLLHTAGHGGVFLAVPAYSGVTAGFLHALTESVRALCEAGYAFELAILEGECHVDDARNKLVNSFLKSSCDSLVFLDTDLRWEPIELLKLVGLPAAIVGATYPYREGPEDFPVLLRSDRIVPLMEADGVPTGFLKISRSVLETLAQSAPVFHDSRRGPVSVLFERSICDGIRWGGDYTFCRKARAAGFGVYVTPDLWLEHGTRSGSLGAHIRGKRGESIAHCLAQITRREDTAATYRELWKAWDNAFAAPPPLLIALARLAREAKGPILEFGSGLSSLVMASASSQPVHAMESEKGWAEALKRHAPPNLTVHQSVLREGWYEGIPDEVWSLVFHDGPNRLTGDRRKFFNLSFPGATVVLDDAPCEMDGFTCLDVGGRFAAFRKAA